MAEQITHDVVKEAQSMGDHSPIDETAASTNHPAGDGEAPSAPPSETTTNATSTAAVDDIPVTDKADDVGTTPLREYLLAHNIDERGSQSSLLRSPDFRSSPRRKYRSGYAMRPSTY